MSNQHELETMPVGKLLFKLAIPTIVAQIINLLYNVVDRMYIGHIEVIGKDALTGVGITMPLIMAISAFTSLVGSGSAPRASIYMGRKDMDTANKILGNAFLLVLGVGISATLLITFFGYDILMMFGASDTTIQYAWEYMQIYALGSTFVMCSIGLNAFITAQGFTRISMLSILIGAITNIVLDPIFIFIFGLGVRGAALATILSQMISCIWILSFLCGKKTVLRLQKQYMSLDPAIFMPCIALGAAPFVMQFTESILGVCFNTSLRAYGGDLAVGAMTICSSAMQFMSLPLSGLTQGAQPIISYNFGAKRLDRVKKAFTILLTSCLVFSFTLWAICQFAPAIIINIFANDAQLAEYAMWAIKIYMGATCLFGAQIACQQTFIALGNAKISLFLALLRKVFLLIPLIFILPNFFDNKVFAVFLAEPIADAIAVITTVTMFVITFKKLLKRSEQSI